MADILDQDISALKEWLRRAWRCLADPSLTPFERRELRNYMKEADVALRSGLKRIAARELSRREAARDIRTGRRPVFRILQLNA